MGACKECGCKDGDRGPQGERGEKGNDGVDGLQGPQGPQGISGIKGEKGDTGIQGDTGPQGLSGSSLPGPTGPTGPQGFQGPAGTDGNDGPQGDAGLNGANGQGRIDYIVETSAAINAIANQGIIMKNTVFSTVQLPLGSVLGDVVQVVGTSYATGNWKIKAGVGETIQLTNLSGGFLETGLGGEVIPLADYNYGDVITMLYDGTNSWIIMDSIFASNTIPLFTV